MEELITVPPLSQIVTNISTSILWYTNKKDRFNLDFPEKSIFEKN